METLAKANYRLNYTTATEIHLKLENFVCEDLL